MDTRRDLAFALVIVVFGIAVIGVASTIRDGAYSDIIGPRAFPYGIGLIMIIGGIAIAMRRFRFMFRELGYIAPLEGSADEPNHKASLLPTLAMLAASAVYAFAMVPMGYPIATVAFIVCAFLVMGERNPWLLGVGAVLFSVSTYYVFAILLNIRIPLGVLTPLARELGMFVL
jgi:putative tricarboxylic transport membrane protein